MGAFSLQETKIFLPYRLGATARDTLQEFIDIDVTADDLVRILDRNQLYRHLFFRFVDRKSSGQPRAKAKGKKPDPAKEEAAKKEEQEREAESATFRLVSLLGMIGSRNLILALQLYRIKEGRFPIGEDGSVDIKASDYLKTAIELEDLYQRNELEYSETAYAIGVFFDNFLNVQSKDPDFKRLEPYYREIIKRAQRTGIVAYLLAAEVPGMSPKFAAAAGMLSQTGKLLLASAYADRKVPYDAFERSLEKTPSLSSAAQAILERHTFGYSHEEVSAQVVRYFELFHSLVPVVRYFREPYCLKGVDSANYKFALLLGLADRMAATWRLPADEKDAVFADWSNPSTGILRLKKEAMILVMKKAMNLR